MTASVLFILYVSDQETSSKFYEHVLQTKPSLDVPGMVEFTLRRGCRLGLMPNRAIKRLLGTRLPDPASAPHVPRSEVYLIVDDPESYHRRALAGGARELSEMSHRDWGDEAAYSLDPDNHVLVFARPAGQAARRAFSPSTRFRRTRPSPRPS